MLHFAVAGVPRSTSGPGGTIAGLLRAHELGITAMELEWVQMVPVNNDRMKENQEVSQRLSIYLTAHAPYYVNLNAQDKQKLSASKKRILTALSQAEIAGVRSVCVHPAFYLGMDPEQVFLNVSQSTEEIMDRKSKLFPHVNLAFETMGKVAQFGTLEEVLKLSKTFSIYPCIDPAHMHARENGAWNTEEEWNTMFDQYQQYLGKKSLESMHMHYSGIEYTEKGERRHLPLRESDARWADFLQVLKKRSIGGTLVCESPLLEVDTLLLKNSFARLR